MRNDFNLGAASRQAAARAMGWAITTSSRLLTAVQPSWLGINPTEDRQRVYFANHVSHGDFVLIWSVLPRPMRIRTRPVAGEDYWLKGGLRRFIGSDVFNSLLIPRNPPEGGPRPVDQMAEALDAGASLIIFPEGTRNLTEERLLEFKSGLYWLAKSRPEIDFVPVWIDNLNRVLPKGAIIPVPLMCKVVFGAPLRPHDGEEKSAFLTRARDALLALRPNQEEG